jgi:hypothetical protein
MTVSTTASFSSFVTNGATTVFPIAWSFEGVLDLKVNWTGAGNTPVALVGNVDFDIIGGAAEASASVRTLGVARGVGRLEVTRSSSLLNAQSYPAGQQFDGVGTARQLDRHTRLHQETFRDFQRASLVPLGETAPALPSLAQRVAGGFLAFAQGTGAMIVAAGAMIGLPVTAWAAALLTKATSGEAVNYLNLPIVRAGEYRADGQPAHAEAHAKMIANIIVDYAGKSVLLVGNWSVGNSRFDVTVSDTQMNFMGGKVSCTGHIDNPLFEGLATASRFYLTNCVIENTQAGNPPATQDNAAIWVRGDNSHVDRVFVKGPFYIGVCAGDFATQLDFVTLSNIYVEGVINRSVYVYGAVVGGSISCIRVLGLRDGVRTTAYGLNVNRSLATAKLEALDVSDVKTFSCTAHGIGLFGSFIKSRGLHVYDDIGTVSFGVIVGPINDALNVGTSISDVVTRGGQIGIVAYQSNQLQMINVNCSDYSGAGVQLQGVVGCGAVNVTCTKGLGSAAEGLQVIGSAAFGTLPARASSGVRIANLDASGFGTGGVGARVGGGNGGSNDVLFDGIRARGSQFSVIFEATATNALIASGHIGPLSGGTALVNSGTNCGVNGAGTYQT